MLQLNMLTNRQNQILGFIQKQQGVSTQEILAFVHQNNSQVVRMSVIRDVNVLLAHKLISREGKGRSVTYTSKELSTVLQYIDPSPYFAIPVDTRSLLSEQFDFKIFARLQNLFTEQELKHLNKITDDYSKRITKLSPQILKKERERLTVELSWKSSQIEGNTYSLLDTEVLLLQHKEAKGHTKAEAVMILNHKKTLDYIFTHFGQYKKISIAKIEDLHILLMKDLGISVGMRKKPVGITGTKYRPLDNAHQIREAMEKLVEKVNSAKDLFSKALYAILLISYIQPFDDGNKRTSRILGNAILMAYGACPLSYRSVDEVEYKKAILLFYEQQSALYFKELFIKQYEFAIKNYFL